MKDRIRRVVGCIAAVCMLIVIAPAVQVEAAIPDSVYVGGMPFGVKFFTQGITIVGFSEVETENGIKTPALDAGLRVNDVITHVNGRRVSTSAELLGQIETASDSLGIDITYEREGIENTVSLHPSVSKDDGKLKTGMWIRDTTAGIGTVTFIVPENGAFAGLGHGICDAETGKLLEMKRGTVVDVTISGIARGVAGTPGELKGYFTSDKSGVLLGNTQCGVYGIMASAPLDKIPEDPIEISDKNAVHPGDAYIWCTLDDNVPHRYSISIENIHYSAADNRCFTIRVTDRELIEKTGGIVQGMSGSPIIQDGRLIGAVTHVLVNDPAEGYGIFIENMIDMMPGLIK